MSEFQVHLTNFSGPFDLLLQLITRHKLDITEVALSAVTDEFIAHIKTLPAADNLDQISHFLVVAATLLDLKAARLLPKGEVEDEEDLAILEARDLLFARLLQYRAFKIVSAEFATNLQLQARRYPRPGGLEEHFAKLLPEVDLSGVADKLAFLAGRVLTPKVSENVELSHLHLARVSVTEQTQIISNRLREHQKMSFRSLVSDADDRLVVVARFLALLELYRNQVVAFEQLNPLGELTINWVSRAEGNTAIGSEFDEENYE